MIVGYFDYLIILILIFLNIKYWNYNVNCLQGCLSIIIFCFVLPIISIIIEYEINGPGKDEVIDGFTMLYVYIKFPLYWLVFFIQTCIVFLKKSF